MVVMAGLIGKIDSTPIQRWQDHDLQAVRDAFDKVVEEPTIAATLGSAVYRVRLGDDYRFVAAGPGYAIVSKARSGWAISRHLTIVSVGANLSRQLDSPDGIIHRVVPREFPEVAALLVEERGLDQIWLFGGRGRRERLMKVCL
ncbi:hypothetical protein CAI21_14385 [Alkalilimnicola ehrlichii]|uniref:Uncharacterized protein n=1 Tax=Alkalilimnicola ehrlichii TaxID=351052 RepID=A0A3E0WKS5_9GAMM|nr:hypothetical protein [Alkalilimnicola ehrlichii]RFA27794.1 hypothetical protein CAI21_14385 [Alkalilimnicola ehrlichii]RFA33560.1 hypothetical protein CAL65_17040 [Alkalilimnicola ehrlichii]